MDIENMEYNGALMERNLHKLKVLLFNGNKKNNERKHNVNRMMVRRDRRNALAKMREVQVQGYREARAAKRNMLNVKRLHRVQKLKQQLKAFEKLQQTNPEEASKKLELEKAKEQKKLNMKHDTTGRWVRNKYLRGKCDMISEMFDVSKKCKHLDVDDELSTCSDELSRPVTPKKPRIDKVPTEPVDYGDPRSR